MVLAVDPSLSSTGVAVGDGVELLGVSTCTAPDGEHLLLRAEELADQVLTWAEGFGTPTLIGVEEPPPTARGDVEHGHQAVLGFKLGLVCGCILSGARARWPRARRVLVPVRAWRVELPVELVASVPCACPAGPLSPLGAISLAPGGGWMVGGLHVPTLEALEALAARGAAAPASPRLVSADERRERLKARAVAEALRRWPDIIGPFIEAARGRARTEKPDHQLVGVSDVCEAALLHTYTWNTHG